MTSEAVNMIYEDTFVAQLDVLGFKNIVKTISINDLAALYKQFSALSINTQLMHVSLMTGGAPASIQDQLKNINVNSMIISDTFLFWTDRTDEYAFNDLVYVIQSLFIKAIDVGVPLRGAITKGALGIENIPFTKELSTSHPSFFGKSIVDTYEMTNNQEWVGCILDKSIEEHAKLHFDWLLPEMESNHIIRRYIPPLKKGTIEEYYVIDWAMKLIDISVRFSGDEPEEYLRNRLMTYCSEISWDIERKIRNTIKFYTDGRDPRGEYI